MRIALVCPYAWEAPGGVQVHVAQLAERLRGRGHEVLVLAPGARAARERWVRLVGRPVSVPYNGTVAPICFSPASARKVRGALARFAPEVVHAHEPFAPSTSMLAVRAASAPVVATFHAYQERSRLMELAAPALRTVWRRIDAAIAVSRAAAAFLARAIEGEVTIVPNGVDVEMFANPGSPAVGLPEGRRVLWVNRLDPQKGFGVMVRAFGELAKRFDDVSLVVAGDGRDRGAVERLPGPVRDRVVLLGPVAHEDLPAYHAAADVFASPALGQESFGLVLVEAMAAGVPVVASDIPGYREVVHDGVDGLLVPSRDPGALATALSRLLEDQDLADRLATSGTRRAAEFSWERVVPQVEAVYERVALDRHRPR